MQCTELYEAEHTVLWRAQLRAVHGAPAPLHQELGLVTHAGETCSAAGCRPAPAHCVAMGARWLCAIFKNPRSGRVLLSKLRQCCAISVLSITIE